MLNLLLEKTGDRLYFSLINFMLWYLIFIENVLPDKLPEIDNKAWLTDPDRYSINTGFSHGS